MDDSESTIGTALKQDARFNCNICLDPVIEPVVTRCGHLYCWPCLFRWLEPGIRSEEALSSWDNFALAPTVDESRRCCPVCKAECSVPTLVPIYVRNEPGTPLATARKRPSENNNNNQEDQVTQETDSSSAHSFGRNEEEEAASAEETMTEHGTTGLRQRLRFRSRDSEIPDIPSDDDDNVPSRPAASPARPTNSSALTQPRAQQTAAAAAYPVRPPLSPHQASLSHGMLLMFQQALNSTDVMQNRQQQRGVPPLHRNDGEHEFGNARATVESPRDDATEFLSRLILILASFVILCLLLF